jgi:hypothetical protein
MATQNILQLIVGNIYNDGLQDYSHLKGLRKITTIPSGKITTEVEFSRNAIEQQKDIWLKVWQNWAIKLIHIQQKT